LKSLFAGELQGDDHDVGLRSSRAIERLNEEAAACGGNAHCGYAFDTGELGGTWTKICAYDPAVVARGL